MRAQFAGLAGVALLALFLRAGLPLSGWYPLKGAVSFAIAMVFVFGTLHGHHPFSRFGAANQITTVRVVLVALVTSLIGESHTAPIATSR
jgi:hypothetical protein